MENLIDQLNIPNIGQPKLEDVLKESQPITDRPKKSHLIRYHMYRSIEKAIKHFDVSGVGLTIADWRPIIGTMFDNVDFYNLKFPDYDIQNLDKIPDNSVDVFYSDMVLEHIEEPQKAIDESYRILKPGGLAIHTTVFMMPYHPSPIDLRRFSPPMLERLHKNYSKVITGGNGNWRSMMAVALRLSRLPVSYPFGNIFSWLLSGENPKYMITTWSVAQK